MKSKGKGGESRKGIHVEGRRPQVARAFGESLREFDPLYSSLANDPKLAVARSITKRFRNALAELGRAPDAARRLAGKTGKEKK